MTKTNECCIRMLINSCKSSLPWSVALLLSLSACTGSLEAQSTLPIVEGVFFVHINLPLPFEEWYLPIQKDSTKQGASWMMAKVHSQPNASAPVLGTIEVALRWDGQYGYNDVALTFLPTGETALREWIYPLGDYGYGIDMGTEAHTLDKRWILLPAGIFGEEAWVRLRMPMDDRNARFLQAYLEPVEGGLFTMGGFPVEVFRQNQQQPPRSPGAGGEAHESQSALLPRASYFVTEAHPDYIVVRPEFESDMACGMDVSPDPPLDSVPFYKITKDHLFDQVGMPRFKSTYKGC